MSGRSSPAPSDRADVVIRIVARACGARVCGVLRRNNSNDDTLKKQKKQNKKQTREIAGENLAVLAVPEMDIRFNNRVSYQIGTDSIRFDCIVIAHVTRTEQQAS